MALSYTGSLFINLIASAVMNDENINPATSIVLCDMLIAGQSSWEPSWPSNGESESPEGKGAIWISWESSLIHKGVNMWFCFNLNQQSSFDSSFKQILAYIANFGWPRTSKVIVSSICPRYWRVLNYQSVFPEPPFALTWKTFKEISFNHFEILCEKFILNRLIANPGLFFFFVRK